jgi:hypothetical protein
MTRKPFRLVMVGLVGCALIVPLGGCNDDAASKATIDTSTPIKAPGGPTVQKVDVKPKPKGARRFGN